MAKMTMVMTLDQEIVIKLRLEKAKNPEFNISGLVNNYLNNYFSVEKPSENKEILLKEAEADKRSMELLKIKEAEREIKLKELNDKAAKELESKLKQESIGINDPNFKVHIWNHEEWVEYDKVHGTHYADIRRQEVDLEQIKREIAEELEAEKREKERDW